VTPDQVRRADAIEFNNWLKTRTSGLDRWRLKHDPDRQLDVAIYDLVAKFPGENIVFIRDSLIRFPSFTSYHHGRPYLNIEHPESGNPGTLATRLSCLTKRRTLVRTPTVAEYRNQVRTIEKPPPDIFRYSTPKVKAPEGPDRSSTVATRLSALASLWSFMIKSGENISGRTQPLLQHNIWEDPLKQVRTQVPSQQAVTRARTTPNLALFMRLLATTFYRTHGQEAAQSVAQEFFWGRQIPRTSVQPSLKDLRDRALLVLMAQTGARSREIYRLKRSDVVGDPAIVTLLGKRGKKRSVAVPPVVLLSLRELWTKIQSLADRSGASRLQHLMTMDAPLLPAVSYWGANAGQSEGGLTRPGIAQVLRRRAERAGMPPGSPDFHRAHPHGLRHLFAKVASDSGTPMNRIQAMMGHASAATTARYMEERSPDMLIAEAFRGPGAVAPVVGPRETPETLEVAEVAPGLEEMPSIAPPGMPAPGKRRMPRPIRRIEQPIQAVKLPEEGEPSVVAPALLAATVLPTIAPPKRPDPLGKRRQFDRKVQDIIKWRKKALTDKEILLSENCLRYPNETLQNLCLIYSLHWGEIVNRQPLLPTGGGRRPGPQLWRLPSPRARLDVQEGAEVVFSQLRIEEEPGKEIGSEADAEAEAEADELEVQRRFLTNQDNYDEDDEGDDYDDYDDYDKDKDEDKDEDEDDEAIPERHGPSLEEMEDAFAEKKEVTIYQEEKSSKASRIYSGKYSGLNWWTGTNGKLSPAMPVMSPGQIGNCSPEKQDEVCEGLVKLWGKWFDESPTKAESLVKWVGETLRVSVQAEEIIQDRGGEWVLPNAPWPETKFLGTWRKPEPRMIFREHLPKEIIAWFRSVADQYRTSPGDPVGFKNLKRKVQGPVHAKVLGERAPSWYHDRDPIESLPFNEKAELLDWILALTGKLPVSTEKRFAVADNVAPSSRAEIARWIASMCTFDDKVNNERIDNEKKTAFLLRQPTIEGMSAAVKAAASDSRLAMSEATGGRVADFDIFDFVKQRVRGRSAVKGKRGSRRKGWYLKMVELNFGKDAAKDRDLKLVAQCGDTPLKTYRELFQVPDGDGTIHHSPEFKKSFASEYGVHSECVARRIARELWEIKKNNPKSQNADRPIYMMNLINIMRTFKVPCSREHEDELRIMLRALRRLPKDAQQIYRRWAQVYEKAGGEHEGETATEKLFRETQEAEGQAIAIGFQRDKFSNNPRRNPKVQLPTPIHLAYALA